MKERHEREIIHRKIARKIGTPQLGHEPRVSGLVGVPIFRAIFLCIISRSCLSFFHIYSFCCGFFIRLRPIAFIGQEEFLRKYFIQLRMFVLKDDLRSHVLIFVVALIITFHNMIFLHLESLIFFKRQHPSLIESSAPQIVKNVFFKLVMNLHQVCCNCGAFSTLIY
jgi:hypothetical protein